MFTNNFQLSYRSWIRQAGVHDKQIVMTVTTMIILLALFFIADFSMAQGMNSHALMEIWNQLYGLFAHFDDDKSHSHDKTK